MHRHRSFLSRLGFVISTYATWHVREVHRDLMLVKFLIKHSEKHAT
jgi:hypothetical protein